MDDTQQLREAIDSWKTWHRKLVGIIPGLEFVEVNCTLEAVRKLVAENKRLKAELKKKCN